MDNTPIKIDTAAGAHAARDFLYRGHTYLAGEPFPTDELTEDQLRMLWTSGEIGLGKPSKLLTDRLAKRSSVARERDERELAHMERRAAKEQAAKDAAAAKAKAEAAAKAKADAKAKAAAKANEKANDGDKDKDKPNAQQPRG